MIQKNMSTLVTTQNSCVLNFKLGLARARYSIWQSTLAKVYFWLLATKLEKLEKFLSQEIKGDFFLLVSAFWKFNFSISGTWHSIKTGGIAIAICWRCTIGYKTSPCQTQWNQDVTVLHGSSMNLSRLWHPQNLLAFQKSRPHPCTLKS